MQTKYIKETTMKPNSKRFCVASSTRLSANEAVEALGISYYCNPGILELGTMLSKPRKRQKRFVYEAIVNGKANPDLTIEIENNTARLYLTPLTSK